MFARKLKITFKVFIITWALFIDIVLQPFEIVQVHYYKNAKNYYYYEFWQFFNKWPLDQSFLMNTYLT